MEDNKCLILLSDSDRKNNFASAHCLKNKMLDILFRVKVVTEYTGQKQNKNIIVKRCI